jgi:hypothetical protein
MQLAAQDVDPQQLLTLLVPPRTLAEQTQDRRPRRNFGARSSRQLDDDLDVVWLAVERLGPAGERHTARDHSGQPRAIGSRESTAACSQ